MYFYLMSKASWPHNSRTQTGEEHGLVIDKDRFLTLCFQSFILPSGFTGILAGTYKEDL